MTFFTKILISALGLVIFACCNDEVFVDGEYAESQSVSINGDGGSYSATITIKGLQAILVNPQSSDIDGINYFNKRGDIIPDDSPASDIARISLTNAFIDFSIVKDGKKLIFTSHENASMSDLDITVVLDYGHTTRFFEINVTPGEPLAVSLVEFYTDTTSSERVRTQKTVYDNTSDNPIKVYCFPYLNRTASAIMIPEPTWANNISVTTSLPTLVDGKWAFENQAEIVLGDNYYYCPARIDRDLTVPVEIPPKTSATITVSVKYSGLSVPFLILFRNPMSGRETTVKGYCLVSEPISYDINVEQN